MYIIKNVSYDLFFIQNVDYRLGSPRTYIHTYKCTHAHTHTHIYIYIYTYIYIYIQIHRLISINTYTHIHKYNKHIDTYVHT